MCGMGPTVKPSIGAVFAELPDWDLQLGGSGRATYCCPQENPMKIMSAPAVLAAVFISATVPCASAPAQEPLPAIELRLLCSEAGPDVVAREVESILSLHEFAAAHDAQVVWLDAVIEADDGAGSCSRAAGESETDELPDSSESELRRTHITIRTCASTDEGATCHDDGIVRVLASGPPLVLSRSVHLPHPSKLAENLPYRMHRYGDWLNYQGPFIVRYHQGTGYAYATFDQPDPALSGVWERARCNARPDDCRE